MLQWRGRAISIDSAQKISLRRNYIFSLVFDCNFAAERSLHSAHRTEQGVSRALHGAECQKNSALKQTEAVWYPLGTVIGCTNGMQNGL